jgi:hypothetical protein
MPARAGHTQGSWRGRVALVTGGMQISGMLALAIRFATRLAQQTFRRNADGVL